MKRKFLITIAGILALSGCVKDDVPEEKASLPDNYISAIIISDTNEKYFATKKGIASFDGTNWKVYNDNVKVAAKGINDLAFEVSGQGPEIWLATNEGVNVASLPIDAISGATTYTRSNTVALFPGEEGLAGDTVSVVTIDDENKRWFGTNNGISVFHGNKWPAINTNSYYSQPFFKTYPISSISYANDTAYIGTLGGGVARMVSEEVDAITAASPYEIPWSMLPSNNVLAVYAEGPVQWYGTDEGLARHTGTDAKSNWVSFYEGDGLANNRVQCITKDLQGNMWFGTPSGLTSFDGETWQTYSSTDGLSGNNILCIAVDADGSLWIGTDTGVTHLNNGMYTTYQAE